MLNNLRLFWVAFIVFSGCLGDTADCTPCYGYVCCHKNGSDCTSILSNSTPNPNPSYAEVNTYCISQNYDFAAQTSGEWTTDGKCR